MDNEQWARSDREKAEAFANHLVEVFKPHTSDSNNIHPNIENEIQRLLESPFQLELPLNKFTPKEVQQKIQRHINPKKSHGHDHISGKILKELLKNE
jgi:hypothetical protein